VDIKIVRKGSVFFSSADEHEMYRLRHAMFRERLNWEVETHDGLEFDEFDALHPLYLIVKENAQVCGCWRFLPTSGPNMLRDVFAELLDDSPAPTGDDIWELSRFAVSKQKDGAFGFSSVPLQMMLHAVRFAREHGVVQLVTVTTPAMERLLRHAGLKPRRLGSPKRIGIASAVALAFGTDRVVETALVNALSTKHQQKAVPGLQQKPQEKQEEEDEVAVA
jgi:acyl homoserine lactone synthase